MSFFFFNDTATTEIYTLSLHDALPIWEKEEERVCGRDITHKRRERERERERERTETETETSGSDRKSTRLNSSHGYISYAVFCLKKKKTTNIVSDRKR